MLKLNIIVLVLAFSNAKIIGQNDVEDIDLDAKPSKPKLCLSGEKKDILWVLDINDDDLGLKHIRSANKMERIVFKEVVEPSIINYELYQISNGKKTKNSTVTTTKKRNTEEITKYDVKKAIIKMLNKFVLFFNDEPVLNTHLGDHNKVSLKLYFKGPYTSMVIRYKNKRFNYFFRPPCSLPRWFYEKHTNIIRSGRAMYVEIPDSVRNEFYGRFFNLLNLFLSYAI